MIQYYALPDPFYVLKPTRTSTVAHQNHTEVDMFPE
jgi:hypothetical protein